MKHSAFLAAILLLWACGASQAANEIFFFHGVVYKNDSVAMQEFRIREGYKDDYIDTADGLSDPDAYEMRLTSKDGGTVFSGVQLISFTRTIDPADWTDEEGIGIKELDKYEAYIKLPYYKQAEYFQLIRKGKTIYSLDMPGIICVSDGKCPDYCAERNDPDCGAPSTSSKPSTTSAQPTKSSTTTTEEEPATTAPQATAPPTSAPEEKPPGGETAMYAVVLLVVLVAAFFLFKRSRSGKDIEKKRQEFEAWKKEQEKPPK